MIEDLLGSLRSMDENDEWNVNRPVSRVFRNIMLISRFCNEVINETAKHYRLQRGDFLVLMALMRKDRKEGLRPTELFNELLVTSGAITKQIDRLQALGLIERLSSQTDKRSSPVRLTPKGRKIGQSVRDRRTELHDIADAFGTKDLDKLDKLLQKYLKTIKQIIT